MKRDSADEHPSRAAHVVRQGECVESIAEGSGHFWVTLWDHPDNAALRRERKDPNVLEPGDVVVVPPLEIKKVDLATSRVHRFRRKGVPSRLRVRFLEEGEPLAHREYVIEVDGRTLTGETDGDGRIDQPIPPRAGTAVVTIGEERYTFALGSVDPIETIEGAAQRLHNLGYDCPAEAKEVSEMRGALRELQHAHDLPVTGELDDATRAALREAHGC